MPVGGPAGPVSRSEPGGELKLGSPEGTPFWPGPLSPLQRLGALTEERVGAAEVATGGPNRGGVATKCVPVPSSVSASD